MLRMEPRVKQRIVLIKEQSFNQILPLDNSLAITIFCISDVPS